MDLNDRLEQRYAQLGSRSPRCRICREDNPFALTGTNPNWTCYECKGRQSGRSSHERHHFAGRRSSELTVPVLGNDHRFLSELQRYWPERTLRNPDGSPLLKAAAALRGWLDILRFLIDRGLAWIPPFLEELDADLSASRGVGWWRAADPLEEED